MYVLGPAKVRFESITSPLGSPSPPQVPVEPPTVTTHLPWTQTNVEEDDNNEDADAAEEEVDIPIVNSPQPINIELEGIQQSYLVLYLSIFFPMCLTDLCHFIALFYRVKYGFGES